MKVGDLVKPRHPELRGIGMVVRVDPRGVAVDWAHGTCGFYTYEEVVKMEVEDGLCSR